jgi:hypothetical protein
MKIGFSTGSIAMADVRRGLEVARHPRAKAVELSALREEELEPLLESLDRLEGDLRQFEYISLHAPSMSHVNSQSRHERLNFESIRAYQRVAHHLSDEIPIILETPVRADEVEDEIASAEEVFSGAHRLPKQPSSVRSAKAPRTTCKHVVDRTIAGVDSGS